ncbi:unnamed protein product [Arctia plantaginis]|uniref:Uncharacterized protein n=1 Tax=Arctia plantaginis TaxID=874455 RepID=A0A8S1BC80_ARCPL|nr:unnamed protein product [Arctia plantaginis]CAB3255965.1 unnamed protein product [Arctia plantaginis]
MVRIGSGGSGTAAHHGGVWWAMAGDRVRVCAARQHGAHWKPRAPRARRSMTRPANRPPLVVMENGALKYGSNNNNNEILEEKVVSTLLALLYS